MLIKKYSDEEIRIFLSESYSLWEFCKKIGYKNKSSRTYQVIKQNLTDRNICLKDYPHLYKKLGITSKKSNQDIFHENSVYDRKDLRRKIIKEGILEYKCSVCGISEWMNKSLTLQLDHINGINNDNRIENLRFLCPNCHTQTSTWGFKRRTR
jgi:5-methylcytosine-specific restriction endonuclease McrA